MVGGNGRGSARNDRGIAMARLRVAVVPAPDFDRESDNAAEMVPTPAGPRYRTGLDGDCVLERLWVEQLGRADCSPGQSGDAEEDHGHA